MEVFWFFWDKVLGEGYWLGITIWRRKYWVGIMILGKG